METQNAWPAIRNPYFVQNATLVIDSPTTNQHNPMTAVKSFVSPLLKSTKKKEYAFVPTAKFTTAAPVKVKLIILKPSIVFLVNI